VKFLFRIVLVLAIIAIVTYLLGYWSPNRGMIGQTEKAAGGLGGRAAQAAQKMDEFVSDAALTGKIKSKMALDDSVHARTISVSTTDGVVTLTGTVTSAAEHDQAVRLARDTKGVKQVVDRLSVVG
jgi:hyperosmotically inducible protein